MNPGDKLGAYEILEPLGAGGMGEVYRARDPRLDRDVAIKVLPEDFAADPERLARFEREAKLLAQLNHSNIAGIYGLDEAGGTRFIAMECVEGETLAERLAASGRIEFDDALEVARQIAEGLEAAHESGIIHRDLKPANVKVTPDGKVKLLDFGLAKAWEGSDDASGTSGSAAPGRALRRAPLMPYFSSRGTHVTYWASFSGRVQVYVRPFVEGADAKQVSQLYGIESRWCRACDELFFRSGGMWMSAAVSFEPEFTYATPRRVFETDFVDTPGMSYDVSPDGQRLLVVKQTRELPSTEIRLVQNALGRTRQ